MKGTVRALLAALGLAAPAKADPRIDRHVTEGMAELAVPGAAVLVLRGDEVVHQGYYGHESLAGGASVTSQTVFATGSVGKTLTVAMIAQLVQQGRPDLDQRLQQILPWLAVSQAQSGLRIRDLLQMQSGFGPSAQRAFWGGAGFDQSAKDFAMTLKDAPIEALPGEGWAYSNADYILLGLVIEEVTGQPYAKAIDEMIFAPLGMTSATVSPERAAKSGLNLHREAFCQMREVSPLDMPRAMAAAGLIFMAAPDLAKFASDRLAALRASSADFSALPALRDVLGPGVDFSGGWMWSRDALGPLVFYHGGGAGMSAALYLRPEQDLAVVAMFNAAAYPGTWQLARGVLDIASGLEPVARPFSVYRLFYLGMLISAGLGVLSIATAVMLRRWSGRLAGGSKLVRAIGGVAAGLGAGLTVILVSALSPGGVLAEFAALPFHSTWWGMLPELALSLLFLIGGLFASALVLLVRRRGRVGPDHVKTALSMQGADI